MIPNGKILPVCDLTELNASVMPGDKLLIKPYDFWQNRDEVEIGNFMHAHGIYVLPTQELIDWLNLQIRGNAIEICAGNGAIGRALGIPITDNRMQEWPLIKEHYASLGQPTIKYPDDVQKFEASEAIAHFCAHTAIGAFVTHRYNGKSGNAFGPNENDVCSRLYRYILIGNEITHADKPILDKNHYKYETFSFPWLITRSHRQDLNRIWVFDIK